MIQMQLARFAKQVVAFSPLTVNPSLTATAFRACPAGFRSPFTSGKISRSSWKKLTHGRALNKLIQKDRRARCR